MHAFRRLPILKRLPLFCAGVFVALSIACAPAAEAPGRPVSPSPSPAATAVFTPSPTDSFTPSPSPAPSASPSPVPAPTPFSIVWMTDTQHYASGHPDIFDSMTQWIADERDARNIVCMVHTGDIVNASFFPIQTERATEAFSRLPEDLRIVTVCGNHDPGLDDGDYKNYLATRPDTAYLAENGILDGLSYYMTFEAGGMRFLLLSIGYGQERQSADWAVSVAAAHPDHYAVLLTHCYLSENHVASGGKYLEPLLVEKAPNLRLVLCGHIPGIQYRQLPLDDDGDQLPDRTVQQMLFNLQATENGGNGFLRVLTFDPAADSISVYTYSPYLGQEGWYNKERYPRDKFGALYVIEDAGLSVG